MIRVQLLYPHAKVNGGLWDLPIGSFLYLVIIELSILYGIEEQIPQKMNHKIDSAGKLYAVQRVL